MASFADLTREEKLGLFLAASAHVALAVGLMVRPEAPREFTIPPRMDVSLASEVSLTSTAPDPSAEPAASAAPDVSELPMPDPAPVIERPAPPVQQTPPPPPPRPQARPTQATPAPRPTATPAPAPTPTARATQAPARERASGSRLNDNFLEGVSAGEGTRGSPAAEAGPAQRASIVQAINRQLKPK